MSKQLTALLLQRQLSRDKNPKQKLLECLRKQGLIKEEEIQEKEIVFHDTCQLCNSSDFIYSNHEKVCNKCGVASASVSQNPYKTYKQNIEFTKGTFIEPGTTIVTVVKNGVTVKRDLAKTNTFISEDPQEKNLKLNLNIMNDYLDILASNYNPEIYERVRNEILSMWYNILIIKPNIRGDEKKSLIAWSIYYPIIYNNLKINIQKIASIIQVTTGVIQSYNFIMRDIFGDTPFEKYLTIKTGYIIDIQLDDNYINKISMIKNHIKDKIDDPVSTKQQLGIIYYLSKLFSDKKYNLDTLAKISNISTTVIANEASRIENFYNKKPFKRQLLTM